MKNLLLGLALGGAIYLGFHAYWWKQFTDERAWKAEQRLIAVERELQVVKPAYTYLAQPVLDVGGQHLSRADLLDLLLSKALNGNTEDPTR